MGVIRLSLVDPQWMQVVKKCSESMLLDRDGAAGQPGGESSSHGAPSILLDAQWCRDGRRPDPVDVLASLWAPQSSQLRVDNTVLAADGMGLRSATIIADF